MNLVADEMDAVRALAWFDSVGLTSMENVDLLAGTYVATGKLPDAEAVADALIADSHAKEFVACERLLETARVDEPDVRSRLHSVRAAGDCGRVAESLGCLLSMSDYTEYALDSGVCFEGLAPDPKRVAKTEVLGIYARWKPDEKVLLGIARDMRAFLTVRGAEEVTVTALEDAVLVSRCDPEVLGLAQKIGESVRNSAGHASSYDERLSMLPKTTRASCDAVARK